MIPLFTSPVETIKENRKRQKFDMSGESILGDSDDAGAVMATQMHGVYGI